MRKYIKVTQKHRVTRRNTLELVPGVGWVTSAPIINVGHQVVIEPLKMVSGILMQ